MDTQKFLTTISVMAKEIEILQYCRAQLETEITALNEQIIALTKAKED